MLAVIEIIYMLFFIIVKGLKAVRENLAKSIILPSALPVFLL
jgi:hypothetical protein